MMKEFSGIKELRLKAGLTQSELARKVHCPQSRISNIENGLMPKPKEIKRIAKALNVELKNIQESDREWRKL